MTRRAAVAAALAVLVSFPWPAGPAAAVSRPQILLDGDPAVRSLDSEDVLLRREASPAATHEFGSALAFGDLNGDGRQDAIVGQRADSSIRIYLGAAALAGAAWYSDPNAADVVILGPPGAPDGVEQLGFSLAAFDLDRDGDDELIAGAPLSDPGGLADAGIVYLFAGGASFATGLVVSVSDPSPPVPIVRLTRASAAMAGDHLGFSMAAGRFAGGTESWLAVSARGADATVPSALADAGVVHVILGSTLFSSGPVIDLALASSVSVMGSDARDNLGESLAACDLDGAGADDLIAGAIFGDGPANAGLNRGEVIALLGENVASGFYSGSVPAAGADLLVHGATDGDDLGFRVACGEMNGDLRADLALSSLFADGPAEARPTAGEVYLLRGRPSANAGGSPARRVLLDPATMAPQAPIDLSVATVPGDPAPNGVDLALFGAGTADQLGFALAIADLDGDGFGDLMASARRYDRGLSLVNTGAVYLLSGSPGVLDTAPQTRAIDLLAGTMRDFYSGYTPPDDHLPLRIQGVVVGASKDDHAGFAVAAGDMDGDGAAEPLIGAIGDLSREPGFPGEAYLLSFGDSDGDGASNLLDGDSDNDGIQDSDEISGALNGGAATDPADPDTDGDGIQDGTELGLICAGTGGVLAFCDDPNHPFTATDPNLPLHFIPDADPATRTDPADRDSDDDGVSDGNEDGNGNGREDAGEMDAADRDSDGDGLFDGTELGVTAPLPDTDAGAGNFVPDADSGATTTDPTDPDTDVDGIRDGVEDANHDGAIAGDTAPFGSVEATEIWSETDPREADTDQDLLPDGVEDADRDGIVDPGETSPLDQDSDEDGLADGWIDGTNGAPLDGNRQGVEGEDLDLDGFFDPIGESDPRTPDTDADGLTDALECGLSMSAPGTPGRNGTPDGGPAGDGTDTTSPAFRRDADNGASRTDPTSADSDGDLIADGTEDRDRDGAVEGDTDRDNVADPGETWSETDPEDPDTDLDGLEDGREDADRNGVFAATESDPLDQDTDDDGLPDGWIDGINGQPPDGFAQAAEGEDRDRDGLFGPADGESSPLLGDSDGDALGDGLEAGLDAGAGVNGLDGVPDGGPGGDGTDITSANYRLDGDPATQTDPADADTDNDGLPDGFIDGFNPNAMGQPGGAVDGIASVYEGEDLDRDGAVDAGETDPILRDSDVDGLKDGAERGVTAPGVLGPDGLPDPAMGGVQDGTGGLGVEFDTNDGSLTDPLDGDTDDDGLSDGTEDTMGNGSVDAGEADAPNHDTDGDLLPDGLELGRITGEPDTDPMAMHFTPDADPATTTDPTRADTDGGGAADGAEDVNLNGRVDPPERDPGDETDDDRSGVLQYLDMAGGTPVPGVSAGMPIFLRLDDDTDENVDPGVAETVVVACSSSDFMDDETVTLTATGPDTGLFEGTIPGSLIAGLDGDGTLSLGSGGSVTCAYTDDDDAGDSRVAVATAASMAPPLPRIAVSILPDGSLEWEPLPGSPSTAGPFTYDLWRGTLSALRQTGSYQQEPVACGLGAGSFTDTTPAPGGEVLFWIVGVNGAGSTLSLGRDSAGNDRPVARSCQ